jgi:hypothetical protein
LAGWSSDVIKVALAGISLRAPLCWSFSLGRSALLRAGLRREEGILENVLVTAIKGRSSTQARSAAPRLRSGFRPVRLLRRWLSRSGQALHPITRKPRVRGPRLCGAKKALSIQQSAFSQIESIFLEAPEGSLFLFDTHPGQAISLHFSLDKSEQNAI